MGKTVKDLPKKQTAGERMEKKNQRRNWITDSA